MAHFWGRNENVDKIDDTNEHDSSSDEIGHKTNVMQVKSIYRLIPAMMVINLVIMTGFISTANGEIASLSLAIWSTGLVLLVCLSIYAWWNQSKALESQSSIKTTMRGVVVMAALFSSVWGYMPFLLVPENSIELWYFSGAAIVGVVCGAGFALAAMPLAVVGFMGPIFVSTSLFIVQGYETTGTMLATLLFIYVCFSVITSLAYIRSLVEHTRVQQGVEEQKTVISLLLKDFEENTSDWLWETDENNLIRNASKRFSSVAGMSPEILNGKDITKFANAHSDELNLTVSAFVESIRNKLTFRDKVIPVELNGELYWWSITGKPYTNSEGEFCGFRGVCSDITVQKKSEERVRFLAHNDALTGLVNRTQFTDQLNSRVSRLERYGTPFSVLYIDLDSFKIVNDSKGHPVGDKLLSIVGERLRKEVRDGDVLARIGGDEFAIIMDESEHDNAEAHLSERIIATVSSPFKIEGEIISIGASIGIAKAPLNGTRPDQILRNADLALYRAKEAGKGVFQFFKAEMDSKARERRTLEFELREALEGGEFELHYQPLLDAGNKAPTGFEALIRWNHPMRGMVSPAEFIPLAEKTGLIVSIGEWVINEACATAASWPNNYTIAVNLSAHQFEGKMIIQTVKDALRNSGLDASRLELEVTESLLIEHPDEVIETLMELKELGVAIAMDDFGTGYSSLSYLMKFPFDKMKIDRSFVVALETDVAARDILKTIAALGDSLNMKITVEGVETEEQVKFLSNMSCDHLQGFYFARPLKKEAIAGYLLQNTLESMDKDNKPPQPVRLVS